MGKVDFHTQLETLKRIKIQRKGWKMIKNCFPLQFQHCKINTKFCNFRTRL